MDLNNISGIMVEDLNESDFSEVSSANLKQILDKIKSLEAKVAQNTGQSGAGSFASSAFQIGKKFGKLKEKMEGMNKEMDEMKKKMEVLRAENAGMKAAREEEKRAFDGMKKEISGLKEDLSKFELVLFDPQHQQKIKKLKEKMAKNSDALIKNMKKEIEEKNEQIVWLNEENAELMKRNRALKRQIERLLFCNPKAEKFLIRRALPAELLSELFASLPMENAFDILAKMPNGLLAKNMRKMFKSIEMAMRNNKWNEADCGPKMAISGGGLVVKHSGPSGYDSVRPQMSFPKFNLNSNIESIAYFEKEILTKHYPNLYFFFQIIIKKYKFLNFMTEISIFRFQSIHRLTLLRQFISQFFDFLAQLSIFFVHFDILFSKFLLHLAIFFSKFIDFCLQPNIFGANSFHFFGYCFHFCFHRFHILFHFAEFLAELPA